MKLNSFIYLNITVDKAKIGVFNNNPTEQFSSSHVTFVPTGVDIISTASWSLIQYATVCRTAAFVNSNRLL